MTQAPGLTWPGGGTPGPQGLFTSMGVGPNTVMPPVVPASPWSRFRDALGEVDLGKYGDAFSGGGNREQDQMQSLPPPLMGPPIMGGNLEHGGTSFSQTMAPAITPELDPSVLPPVGPWSIPDVTTAVPDDRYVDPGTVLYPPRRIKPRIPMDLSGFGGYLRSVRQPQY